MYPDMILLPSVLLITSSYVFERLINLTLTGNKALGSASFQASAILRLDNQACDAESTASLTSSKQGGPAEH